MRVYWIVSSALVCVLASVAISQEKVGDAGKEVSPEQMMEAMLKYGTPGAEHEKLKPMEGTFNAEVTMQMTPQAPPMTSQGKIVNKMVMGGRFLQGDYTGDFGGQPFSGTSFTGFDNLKKKYTSLWFDSMSTSMMLAEGEADASGKTVTFSCTYDCPITEGKRTSRQVIRIVDANTHTYEMFDVGDGGKEHKTMSIKYTRAK